MVDTRNLKDYIKLSDLDPGDIIEFSTSGEIVNRDFAKQGEEENIKPCLEMMVSLNGQSPKKLTINQTTINIINEHWTRDTDKWVGRKAAAEKRKILSFGKWIDIIVLEPIDKQDTPPVTDEPPINPSQQEPEPEVEPQPPQAATSPSGCACTERKGGTRKDPQNENIDICNDCDLPVVAWDED